VREEELKEGEDYYLEDGYLVFTEAYHLKRLGSATRGAQVGAKGFSGAPTAAFAAGGTAVVRVAATAPGGRKRKTKPALGFGNTGCPSRG
jgi:hypothetical protein